jgi:hypothetical protein
MAHNTIAIVADCDDTLAPDTTLQLLNALGVDAERFFRDTVAPLVASGWDPPLAYLREMIRLAQSGAAELTKEKIGRVARDLEFYPGVPDFMTRLKGEIEEHPRYRDFGIRVDCYVISGGIEELIGASALREALHGFWGCSFDYDDVGRICFPRKVISFTDKTRYLFNIQKGKVADEFRGRPYAVNEPMDHSERPVPFSNMFYLGDGPSDIPCMSLIQANRGYVVGILNDENPARTWALGYGRRANVTVPPDFTDGSIGYKQIRQAVAKRADIICDELAGGGIVPSY